jgi:uncharacterized membrane protein YadS
MEHLQRLLPEFLLCAAVTLAAMLLQDVEVSFAGQPYLEALVLAILIGVAVRIQAGFGVIWRIPADASQSANLSRMTFSERIASRPS